MSSKQLKMALKEAAVVDEDASDDEATPAARAGGFASALFSDQSSSSSEESSSDEEDDLPARVEVQMAEAPAAKKVGKPKVEDEDEDALLEAAIRAKTRETMEMDKVRVMASGGLVTKLGDILTVEKKYLSAQAEFRRRFGVDKSERRAKRHGHQSREARKYHLKTPNVFVDIDPRWSHPPSLSSGAGIGMKLSLGTSQALEPECTYFTYEYGDTYHGHQIEFDAITSMHDPNAIVFFHRHNPHHVGALLQLSSIYSMSQDFDNSRLALRQAIYVYQCGLHPKFLECVQRGTARMDLDLQENAIFAKALFSHALNSGKRGSRQSALELLKLLLILDPRRDPMGVLLCIDYYAIAAKEYEMLVNLMSKPQTLCIQTSEADSTRRPLTVLPNMAFSEALALFFLARRSQSDRDGGDSAFTPKRAKHSLLVALFRFPSVFPVLLDAAESKIVKDTALAEAYLPLVESNLWKEEKDHPLVSKLVRIFVKRSSELWKDASVMDWLIETAEEAVELYRANASLLVAQRKLRQEVYRVGQDIAFTKEGVYRYASVNAFLFNDEAVHIPIEDPHQPASLNQGLADLDLNANPALLFLQTLMPWNNAAGGSF